jgi:hypothetical protein
MKKYIIILQCLQLLWAFNINIEKDEKFVLILQEPNKETIVTHHVKVQAEQHRLTIFLEGSDGIDSHLDMNTKTKHVINFEQHQNKNVIKKIIYNNKQVHVNIPNKNANYTQHIRHDVFYDMNNFPILFRGFNFAKDKEITFFTHLPEFRRFFEMTLQLDGEEDFTYKNQTIPCFRLELAVSGWIESLLFPQKFYFLISQTKPHLFLKYWGSNIFNQTTTSTVIYHSKLEKSLPEY